MDYSHLDFHMKETIGGNLILFKDGDSSDLARKIIQILHNPKGTNALVEKQMEYVKNETWDLAARRTARNYQITLGQ